MNDRILSLLGLCRRAGKLTLGFDLIAQSITDGSARLVVTASDISKSTGKKLGSLCEKSGVELLALARSKEELSLSLGRLCVAASVCDSGFAAKLSQLINSEKQEENV